MNTVIIPVDFSETSLHAAEFGAKWLSLASGVEIILYHVCDKDDSYDNRMEALQKLKDELTQNRKLNISLLAETGDFITELEKLARHRQADLIIMGITNRSALMQVFVGSNALKMAENKFCPVIIVPLNAVYNEIKNVLVATDLKNTSSTTPSAPIKKVLSTFGANLHIVNVNSEHYIALTEELADEQQKLKEMFSEFNPEFYFLRLYDVDEAIEQFSKDKNIDLIITIQKEHSVMHRLFKAGHLKKLALESNVPVMSVHE
ncbi:MAG: universal stress protein [Parafilimonas sp.]|nr:universal stress protein [Parafilimonas sp.]